MFVPYAIIYKDKDTCIMAENKYDPSNIYTITVRSDGSQVIWDTEIYEAMGARLYNAVETNLKAAAADEAFAVVGYNIPAINPRKITGMILESATLPQIEELLADPIYLAATMIDACDALVGSSSE